MDEIINKVEELISRVGCIVSGDIIAADNIRSIQSDLISIKNLAEEMQDDEE